ncbi:ATP-binding protein [Pseudonocardia spinosispora]|uniref:ATP-binding protein n=1 Tax=Pseudonocardia spinosispora TaxID=103441 RepID=UPI00041B8FC3|nr:ATP-binding protein [Pseudonocardia spinosispora]
MIVEPPASEGYLRYSWPADPHLAVTVRAEVHRWLSSLALSDDDEASVIIAVDAAMTNVMDHAYDPGVLGSVELVLWTEPSAVCIEVVDYGTWRAPAEGSTGHGIALMKGLVESVRVHVDERGTRVLLRNPLRSRPSSSDPDPGPEGG